MTSRSSKIIMTGALLATIGVAITAGSTPTQKANDAAPTEKYAYLNQGWDTGLRQAWYTTSQGSLMMPYDWWFALEEADNNRLLKDGLQRFGILPGPVSKLNPDGLPLGFARGDYDQEYNGIATKSWIGPTCAACHTSALKYKKPGDATETTLLMEGGQNNLDWGAFRIAMSAAIAQTRSDSAKFDRFAKRVLGKGGDASQNRATLRSQFAVYAAQMAKERQADVPVYPWGPGRIDAFGAIFNRVSMLSLGIPGNQAITDAPASIPFIWNLHHQDHMQWHGETVNTRAADRLGRNAGEVLGTYGLLIIDPTKPVYATSVNAPNLVALENWLGDLRPPKWPEDLLGKIDAASAMRGKPLYDKNCASCHTVLGSDPKQMVKIVPVPLKEIGTDPKMSVNFHTRYVQTGPLQGQPMFGPSSAKFGETARMMDIMNHVATHWDVNTKADMKIEAYTPAPEDMPAYRNDINNWGYEAKPLNGIWATAPFLHNGSVSSLSQLLLPANQRMKTFSVGTLSFDPVNVGYQTDAKYGGSLFDTSLPGNRNTGHEYGTNLSESEKKDLLEYLKTL